MPIFVSGVGLAPAWSELEYFEIVQLWRGQSHLFPRVGDREKLIVGEGECRIVCGEQEVLASQGTNLDLAPDLRNAIFDVVSVPKDATLIRMCGGWGAEVGGSGLFSVDTSPDPQDRGDQVNYVKTTDFDSHYHDCDEYWIVYAGSGVAVSEGCSFTLGVGDCLATGMGHHHDVPEVFEAVRAVYFETTMEGQKRRGHLWNHSHGLARPEPDRI